MRNRWWWRGTRQLSDAVPVVDIELLEIGLPTEHCLKPAAQCRSWPKTAIWVSAATYLRQERSRRSPPGPEVIITHRLLSSSFLCFIFRILYGNPKKELLRSLWVASMARSDPLMDAREQGATTALATQ